MKTNIFFLFFFLFLEMGFSKETPSDTPLDPNMIKASEHPEYAVFFKMMKIGLARPQVEHKMTMAGLDTAILDKPHELVPKPEEGDY